MAPARTISNPKYSLKISGTISSVPTAATEAGPTATAAISIEKSLTLTTGAGQNQANRGWQVIDRTANKGVTFTIDLYDFADIDAGSGLGNDPVGNAMSPIEEIVAIVIINNNAIGNAGLLQVGPAAANGCDWLGDHTVANGGALRAQGILFKAQPHETGFDITDANNQVLEITASGDDVSYILGILARHDDDVSSSSASTSSSSVSSSSSTSSASSSSSSSNISTSSESSSSISTSISSASSASSTSSSSSSISTSSESSSSSSSPG
jgi:hypothetical protein